MDAGKNIPVLGPDNRFLSYTSPPKARILIKRRKALVFNKDPFIIKLKGDGEDEMVSKRTEKLQGMVGSSIANFTKYFAVEREVYVQNMGSTQITLTFPVGPGDHAHVIIPRTRKPFNLTQHVPFAAIKAGMDFRKIINRRPPVLRLMEEEEYITYYDNLAIRNRTSFEDELAQAQSMQDTLMRKPRISSERLEREMKSKLEDKMEELEKPVEINPKIIGLCALADKEQGDNRISAGDFLDDLEAYGPQLTIDDWEFVMSKGVYKTVKNFAAQQLETMTATDEDEEE